MTTQQVRTVCLSELCTDTEMNKKLGDFFNGDDYETIDGNVDATCDGKFVFKLRKGVFRKGIVPNLKDVYFPEQNNRGMSAGEINEEELIKKVGPDIHVVRRFKYVRRKKDGTLSKFFLSNPVRSNIVGYFDYINYTQNDDGTKSQSRNIKITQHTTEKSLDAMKELTETMDQHYRELMPDIYNSTKDRLIEKGFKEFLYGDCLTTTITVNTDFRTALHKDKNNYNRVGLMAVLSDTEEEFEGGELILPRYGVKVNVRPGDLIVFESGSHHTNNVITGDGRYSFVFYIRENIVKAYDESSDGKIHRSYVEDLFINYDNPCILVKEKDTKHREKFIEFHKKTGLPLYRLSKKTSFNPRGYGDVTIRYINKEKESLFTNGRYIEDVIGGYLQDPIKVVDVEPIHVMSVVEYQDYRVCIISHLRPSAVHKMEAMLGMPCHWYVGDGEGDTYRDAGAKYVCESGKLCESRNMALQHCFTNNEICIQLSDDLKGIKMVYTNEEGLAKGKDVSFRRVIALMKLSALQTGAKLLGVAPTDNPYFCVNGDRVKKCHFIVGDMSMIYPTHLRYDTNLRLKEDYDYTAQHILEYGKVGRCDDFMFSFTHYTNKGGAVDVRTKELELETIAYLRNKWGSDVFPTNTRRKNSETEILLKGKKITKINTQLPTIVEEIEVPVIVKEKETYSITSTTDDLEKLKEVLKHFGNFEIFKKM